MNDSTLYALWGGLYLACLGLGFIREPQGMGKAILILLALCFFVPGWILLHRAARRKDRQGVIRIRLLSGLSLSLTLLLLVANLLSAGGSEGLGYGLHAMLMLVSAPMACGQYWVASLFLWACLLTASFLWAPPKKKK